MTTRYNPELNCWYEDVEVKRFRLVPARRNNWLAPVALLVFFVVSLVVINL